MSILTTPTCWTGSSSTPVISFFIGLFNGANLLLLTPKNRSLATRVWWKSGCWCWRTPANKGGKVCFGSSYTAPPCGWTSPAHRSSGEDPFVCRPDSPWPRRPVLTPPSHSPTQQLHSTLPVKDHVPHSPHVHYIGSGSLWQLQWSHGTSSPWVFDRRGPVSRVSSWQTNTWLYFPSMFSSQLLDFGPFVFLLLC